MTIKVGDLASAGKWSEFIESRLPAARSAPTISRSTISPAVRRSCCSASPGAFTRICSAKHVPSYVANYDKLKAKGVDDILHISVNDASVMGAWSKDQKASGKIRMMGTAARPTPRRAGPGARSHRTQHGRSRQTALGADQKTASSRRSTSKHRASTKSPAPKRCSPSSVSGGARSEGPRARRARDRARRIDCQRPTRIVCARCNRQKEAEARA